jgi:hypothetical protein
MPLAVEVEVEQPMPVDEVEVEPATDCTPEVEVE